MQINYFKNITVMIIFLFFSYNLFASTYTNWLNSFEKTLNIGVSIDVEEKTSIEEELSVLPEGEGTDYDAWINILRRKLQYGPDMSTLEKQILDYVLKAKPKNNGSRYMTFLNLLEQHINSIGAVLDDSEKAAFNYIMQAKTEAIPSPQFDQFQVEWQNKYQFLKNRFGTLDASEQYIMQIFMQAKPNQREVTLDDPIQQSIRVLFVNSPSVIASTISSNNYQQGSRMMEIIEAFYMTLKRDYEKTGDTKLKDLLDRFESLKQ